nr:hypothetical protein BCU62_24820 [Enterovibrio norvegicus]
MKEIVSELKLSSGKYEILKYENTKMSEVLDKFGRAKFFITERYHGAVIAESLNKNWLCIPFSEKLNRIKPNYYKL